jgi:hypothetical protein
MKRFQSIQIMRGIAASMVVLYHFGYSNSNFLAAFPSFGSLFRYGDLGVWIVFCYFRFRHPLCDVFDKLQGERGLDFFTSAHRST